MAALNFPSSPTNGQEHTENGVTYQYWSNTTAWIVIPGGGAAEIPIYEDNQNASRYIVFIDSTSGVMTKANIANAEIYCNPSTGELSATSFNSLSDIAVKEDIAVIQNALEKTSQLRGVTFNWKHSGTPSAGVIAQELKEVLPEVVTDKNTVNYSGVIALLIEAVKELEKKVEELTINTTKRE